MVTVGAQFVEVEVDAETGVVRVLRVVAVHDAGRIINPALAESLLAERETGIISAHTAGVVDVGWAYLVRRTSSERPFLRVLAAVPTSDPPLVQARTMGAWGTKPARADSAFTWRLPDTGPFPQLVEVRVEEPPGRRGKRGAVPVLVTLAEAP